MTDGYLFDLTKPAYTVPALTDVLARNNGLTAVSTFSGCGGSSLGLHMAGWRVPYAVEFIPAARDTYLANFPGAEVDDRDIRVIDPEEILDRLGVKRGEVDLAEGSPPCSSFAAINTGATRYGAAKVKHYSEGVHQQTDDLFDEWLRVIEGLLPRAILAENVPGLLGDNSAAFYRTILTRLAGLGYEVDAGRYNAMHYGAATSRERLVIRGVRRDVGSLPARPRRTGTGYTLGDALASLPTSIPDEEMRFADMTGYAVGREWEEVPIGSFSRKYTQIVRCALDRPMPGITAAGSRGGTANPMHPTECRLFTPTELAWVFGFPADFRFTGTPAQAYERIARCVAPPLYAAHGRVLAAALGGSPCAG